MKSRLNEVREALKLYDAGLGAAEAARRFSLGYNTLRRGAKRLGRPLTHWWLWPKNMERFVARLYSMGYGIGEIERMTAICASTCYVWAKRHGCKMRSPKEAAAMRDHKGQVPPAFSFVPLNPSTAWLLGLIYSDGCMVRDCRRVQVTVGNDDPDGPVKIKHVVGGDLSVDSGVGCKQVQIYSTRIWAELRTAYGLTPNKGRTMQFPNIPADMLPHFVRGVIDGDGCWHMGTKGMRVTGRRGGRAYWALMTYVSASRAFIDALLSCIRAQGIVRGHPSIYSTPTTAWARGTKPRIVGTAYRFTIGHGDSVRLGQWIYPRGTEPIRYERKYKRWAYLSRPC